MRVHRFPVLISLVAALAACGGGGGNSAGGTVAVSPAPTSATPTPTQTTAGCSVSARQSWVLDQLNEWYLFPELLSSSVNPASYSSVQPYIDALVAPARAQSKDRFFTFITSIAEENAFFNSGATAGFGVRLSYDQVNFRVFVAEAFEGAPALAAGLDRGTELLAIGTSANDLRNVSSIMASEGAGGVTAALGPSTAGTTRVLRLRSAAGAESTVAVTKQDFALLPVSSRYGVKVITEGGEKFGYINLRTFIDTADPGLRNAVATLKAQGVNKLVVDLRYNGGGLVSIAELMSSLLGADRNGQVQSYTTFRASKASNNETEFFRAQSQSIASTKIAFIGTGSTASASELVINSFKPYLGNNIALVGSNTFGKPVGQIGLDRSACDDRLRVVAFRTENASREGDYFTGLADRLPQTCRAVDDISVQLGDPAEASTRAALDFLQGKTCTPIASGEQTTQGSGGRQLLQVLGSSTAQREVPGLF